MSLQIPIDREKIEDFCIRNGMRKLSFFGSVLRDDFNADSDIDVLVEFYPDRIPDFFEFIHYEDELSEILDGRKVDLLTERFLHELIRQRVIETMETLYVES